MAGWQACRWMQEVRSAEQAGRGCSLLHLAPPGSGPGWLVRQAAGVGEWGGTCDPLPALRLRQVRASLGAALRSSESARARGQIQPGMPQYFRLRSDRAQRAGLWPPRPRAAVTRAPGARAVGPRAKRAQEAEPRTWARPLSRGGGR